MNFGRGPIRGESGEDLVELAMFLPLLILVTYGSFQVGQTIDSQNTLRHVTQEGVTMVAEGMPLPGALEATIPYGSPIELESRGGLVVSRLVVESGVPVIREQAASAGYRGNSRIGLVGESVADLMDTDTPEGTSLYVFEAFYQRPPQRPIVSFLSALAPDLLYERAVF